MTRLLHHPLEEVRTDIPQQQLNQSTRAIAAVDRQLFGISNAAENSSTSRSLAVSLLTDSRLIDKSWADGRMEASDKLRWTLRLFATSGTEELRCAALAAAGRVAALAAATSTLNSELVLEWSRLIVDECQSGSVHLRSAVVQSMDSSLLLLLLTPPDTSAMWGQVLSNCWMCLLRCLMDDDEAVRCHASALVAQVTRDSRTTHPAVALDRALGFFVDDVGRLYPAQVVVTLVNLMRNEAGEAPEEDSQSFEKGDSDTFHDPVFHSILFGQFMKRCVDRNPIAAEEIADLLETLNIVSNLHIYQCLNQSSFFLVHEAWRCGGGSEQL